MKIGLLCCFYNCADQINNLLHPWLLFERDPNIHLEVAVVHGQFKEYHDLGMPDDDLDTIKAILHTSADFVYAQNMDLTKMRATDEKSYLTEAELRDKGLQYLLKRDLDFTILLDSDEFYTVEQIRAIFNFVKKQEFVGWFSINFKNYIFDGTQWIDGFCPPRIFVHRLDNIRLNSFYWDNDVQYLNEFDNKLVSYKSLSSLEVPRSIAHIKHLTWLHSNGREKYEYQMKHFGTCGYKWNYETSKLEFNQEYYLKHHLPLPTIYQD